MGRYNPHVPRILGQEWVPIRDENIIYNQFNNNVERGYTFSVEAPRILQQGKFYINKFPENFLKEEVMTIGVYPAGKEEQSGPIQTVLIPCNNGTLTGGVGLTNPWSLFRANSVADALQNPSDNRSLEASLGATAPSVNNAYIYFAVNQYAQLLQGKRILGLNLVYSAFFSACADPRGAGIGLAISTPNPTNSEGQWRYPNIYQAPDDAFGTVTRSFNEGVLNRVYLGDTNLFFGSTTNSSNPPVNVVPWTYSELQRFEMSNASPYAIYLNALPSLGGQCFVEFGYMALEVVYCEETRVAVGSTVYNISTDAGGFQQFAYVMGGNSITLRDPVSLALNPTLNPGTNYTVTLSQSNVGDAPLVFSGNVIGPQPQVNALRELYALPSLPGVEIKIPFPPDEDIDGEVFTVAETHIIPQISLYASGAPMTEIHPYGRQSIAQVYGTITATQEILDDPLNPAANYSWPQVRYYARRFGDTVIPLKLSALTPTVTGAGFMPVFLTPQQWDALPEILDGWKEVTLRFPVPPIMSGSLTTEAKWVWSAAGETAGNRWEVLGATAPALSGLPGNMLNLAYPPNQLGPATYGAPFLGVSVDEEWMPGWSPPVSGTTDDPASDAVLIFSQDMPTVTGMTVVVQSQPVTGIGQNCGIDPAFIPDFIQYNQISWPYQVSDGMNDYFTRTVVAGWGTSTSGVPWTVSTVNANWAVNGSQGQVTLATLNTYYAATNTTTNYLDVTGSYRIASSIPASGSDHWGSVFLRSTGGTANQLYVRVGFELDGTVKLYLTSVTASVHTTLASTVIAGSYTPGTFFNVKFDLAGLMFKAKAWIDGDAEPVYWTLNTSITTNTGPGTIGVRAIVGNGSPVPTLSFDNLIIRDSNFGYYELQRQDPVDTTWMTIMKVTSPAVSGFSDFEARVGLLASYRMRGVNVLEFAGPWSTTFSTTIPEPGVLGTAITADANVLIFTTNELQNGSANLAYAMAWEGSVSEDFSFPEASFVALQSMYNKDFFTAFRPRERGGERFSRTILVQAAAIAAPTLADFTSLRDMAWEAVNYICVRDQEGNRWFATVLVPSGKVRHFRRIYMAEIEVIEVTDTPTPVDPS